MSTPMCITTLIFFSVEEKQLELESLICNVDDEGSTLLHLAVDSGILPVIYQTMITFLKAVILYCVSWICVWIEFISMSDHSTQQAVLLSQLRGSLVRKVFVDVTTNTSLRAIPVSYYP